MYHAIDGYTTESCRTTLLAISAMCTHAISSWCIAETIITTVQQSISLAIAQVRVESKYRLGAWVPGSPDNREEVSILDAQRWSPVITGKKAAHVDLPMQGSAGVAVVRTSICRDTHLPTAPTALNNMP